MATPMVLSEVKAVDQLDEDSITLKPYVVLFIDIQGQKEAIRKLTPLPLKPEENPAYIASLKQSIGKVDAVRQRITDYLAAVKNNPAKLPIWRLGTNRALQYLFMREHDIRVQVFSDTVIAYSPLHTTSGQPSIGSLYCLLGAACTAMVSTLPAKCAIRGAIEIDVATELHPLDLYGPAVASAYRLESEVAEYPRIVVGEGVLQHIPMFLNPDASDDVSSYNHTLASLSEGLIHTDADGLHVADYLGGSFRSMAPDILTVDLAQKCLSFAEGEQQRFTTEGNTKLSERYARLRQYITTKLNTWTPA